MTEGLKYNYSTHNGDMWRCKKRPAGKIALRAGRLLKQNARLGADKGDQQFSAGITSGKHTQFSGNSSRPIIHLPNHIPQLSATGDRSL